MLTEKITVYLIWSLEHKRWWRSGGQGYTEKKESAGQYEFDVALDIVLKANIDENDIPNEAIVPVEVCSECMGTGEVVTMGSVYPNEPHQAPIDTRPCICKVKVETEE